MSEKKRTKTPTLRELNRQFSPDFNPLVEPKTVETKRRYVRAAKSNELVDPTTGEVRAVASIHTVEEKDDKEFVKIFAEGVKAMYGLTRTGMRVFQAILDEYQDTKMSGGFADAVFIHWFGDGLQGRDIGMSERTFQNGLKELLLLGFISPRAGNLYWVNPALFFKGDRVAFIKEYRRKKPCPNIEQE
ncbi:replication/maintenance protein RepL [Neiella sp. HB171785]|uniref:Replication/maintenance protein RepL n=1 Tax=Neiella litorisoli TaxID=2771431 RepID=A0A8J6QJD1_9GAMM|nr:replication/maintenance protein RepL [Neiella litorisoli]MBD1391460.1 replication/maintenance protein RepL [Neiella litorisoli]